MKLREPGVGISQASDGAAAAREAVGAAIHGQEITRDDLVITFPTIDGDQAVFFEAARRAAEPAHVVGCSSYSSFSGDAQVDRGVVAAFYPVGDLSFGVAGVDGVSADIYGAARDVTQQALDRATGPGDHAVLLMLSDGLAGDQREVVRGSYEVTGATVPLVGGTAGDDLRMHTTYQYLDGTLMTNGLVAVWINSTHPLGVGVRHGWRPAGEPMIVTRADGNVVHELDGRPAVRAYASHRGADPDRNADATATFATSMIPQPLGLATVSGHFDVRHLLGRTADGGLVMFGHINEQSVVEVMSAESGDLIAAAEGAAADAIAQMRTEPRGAIVFSCAARVPPLGGRLTEEAATINRLVRAPVSGFFTYGEFARVTGSTGFHNATVVVLTL